MSDAIESKNLPLVTSLTDTDTLLAVGSDGNGKRIKLSNAQKQNTGMSFSLPAGDDRWVRIAKMTDYGSSCILSVTSKRVGMKYCVPVTMIVTATHAGNSGNQKVIALSEAMVGSNNSRYPFSKIRITGTEGVKYIDIFVHDLTATAQMYVGIACAMFSEMSGPEINPALLTNTKEFEIADIFGGG